MRIQKRLAENFNIQYPTRNIQPNKLGNMSRACRGSDRSFPATRLRWRLLCGLAVAWVMGQAPQSYGQVAPDLTMSQTQGVNESDFFFLGPTGMRGWMYYSSQTRNARQILVTQVPAGSPAEGVMMRHDVILGIGDGGMFPHDARVAFVDALIAAEASDGQLHLNVYRPSTKETSVRTIQLGMTNAPLAATTPYSCPKALAILTNYCEQVHAAGPLGHPTREFSVWAMLGSGIEKYENWAINWIQSQTPYSRTNLSIYRPVDTRNWDMSYTLATLAQYYLFMKAKGTPDEAVLPAIENLALFIANGQDRRGQWGHTYAYPRDNGGQLHGTLPGYGALNNAGLVSLYGLALTQKCGITNNAAINAAVEKSAAFFRANVGIGTINYGFHDPIPSVVDVNGRMGIAAVVFRALGDVEAAKWFAMMTSTYGWRNWGHTGNELNHAWGPLAANVGGPDLVNFVHTNRNYNAAFNVDQPYHQVTLHMLRQPSGQFQSQGQGGQGTGRNGHATGSYALQMAIPKMSIDVTGAGYGEAFWLTEDEMEQVRIGFKYESEPVTHLSTEELLEHLGNFSPRVFNKMAGELRGRMTDDLRNTLIAIVEHPDEQATKRVAALVALDAAGREAVKATTDTWYAPSNGYVLNYGARDHAFRDHASIIKMLEAIAQFDRSVPFDMLVVGNYSYVLRNISRASFTEEELAIYYAAIEVILSPDSGNVFHFVENQGIPSWPPARLARYADSILRVAEMPAMAYNAGRVLATPPIGEGMYSWMVRSRLNPGNAPLDTLEHWRRYGMNAMIYTNHLLRLKTNGFSYDQYSSIDSWLEFHLPANDYELHWFRNLIAANVAADHPGATDEQLRALLAQSSDQDDLYRAVVLDKLVKQIGTTAAFDDILPYVGFCSPIDNTNWRLSRGAVEIATNTAYSTDQQWLDALGTVDANDHVRIGGILHALAGRGVTDAKALAEPYLLHENDFVTIGALDVYRAVGAEADLVMLFNQFMTNVSTVVEGETTFANDFKIHAYWDAIHAIVERDAPILEATANAIAAAFNERTNDGASMTGIAIVGTALAEPMSVLNPVGSNVDKVYGQYVTGPIGILGLFPDTDCDQALQNVYTKIADSQHWGRGHKYAASEAFMRRLSHAEIVQRQKDGVSAPWNDRIVVLYLLTELLQERVPIEVQLDLLTLQYNNLPLQGGSSAYPRGTAQNELNRRRGLEEQDAIHYFFMK
jgi:hypothetical protein